MSFLAIQELLQQAGAPVTEFDDGTFSACIISEMSQLAYTIFFDEVEKPHKGRPKGEDTHVLVLLPHTVALTGESHYFCKRVKVAYPSIILEFNTARNKFGSRSQLASNDFVQEMNGLIYCCDILVQLLTHTAQKGRVWTSDEIKLALMYPHSRS